MLIQPGDLEFLASLAPPDPNWGGTGALPLAPDSRDFQMERIPRVAQILAEGLPTSADLTSYVKGAFDQGAEGSCVAWSTCGVEAVYKSIEHGVWLQFDGRTVYHDLGGTGQNGVDTRQALAYAQTKGLPLTGDTRRMRLGSYARAPQTPGAFRDTIKAAVAAGHPCTLAVLLPENFSWTSSGRPTSGYHQLAIVAWDDTWATVLNSWGRSWGKQGLGRLAWDFLEASNLQNGYCYSWTTVDDLQDGLSPNPPPGDTYALCLESHTRWPRDDDRHHSRRAAGHGHATVAH